MASGSVPTNRVNYTPRGNGPGKEVDHVCIVFEKDREGPLTAQEMYVGPGKGERFWNSFNPDESNNSTLYAKILEFLYQNDIPRTYGNKFSLGWEKRKPKYSLDKLHTHFKKTKNEKNNRILYLVKDEEFLVVGLNDREFYSILDFVHPRVK
jgi:hypothetical protein